MLTYLGAAIAIWARIILGQNWSARVTLKVGHELIRSGPYRYVRHPIYTGMLLAMIGTAMVAGEWRGAAAVALSIIAFCLKAQREEQFMVTEFGETYHEYRSQTGFLVPGL
jgi:protein-S-isoprenylcysteine O-methyltransferase Ste14